MKTQNDCKMFAMIASSSIEFHVNLRISDLSIYFIEEGKKSQYMPLLKICIGLCMILPEQNVIEKINR